MPDSPATNTRPASPVISLARKILAWRLFSRGPELSGQKAAGALDIIKWWELRRIPYNLIVGAAGMLTLIVIVAVAAIAEWKFGEPFGMPDPPIFAIFAVIAYGIGANICFTGGWFVEIIVRKIWAARAGDFGQISFALGLVFSVLLTLAPAALIAGVFVLRLLLG